MEYVYLDLGRWPADGIIGNSVFRGKYLVGKSGAWPKIFGWELEKVWKIFGLKLEKYWISLGL